jgi:predicted nucleic acid-binding protein
VPELPPLRVYLDSNVLFSAAYDPQSPFLNFWKLRDISPVISQYVVGEVSRNVRLPHLRARFETLLAKTQFFSDADGRFIPSHIVLVEKDRPILAASIAASLDYLVTGDKNHFAHLYNTAVSGVHILDPATFLKLHKDRLIP